MKKLLLTICLALVAGPAVAADLESLHNFKYVIFWGALIVALLVTPILLSGRND